MKNMLTTLIGLQLLGFILIIEKLAGHGKTTPFPR
jgi:hypothetical protein